MFAKQRNGGYISSDLDSSDDELLKIGMNQAEQMHILASSGINAPDSNIEIDEDFLKRYNKQAKKYFKKQ